MKNFTQYITELHKPDKFDAIIAKINKAPFSHDNRIPREMVKKYLLQFGISQIGKGSYGNVFSVPNYPWVIKVWSTTDEGYPKWLNFVKNNVGNPYLPVIKGAPTKIGNSLMGIRLEPLIPMSFTEWKNFDKYMNSVDRGEIENPELLKILKGFYMYDLHDQNVMFRPSTMTPVIIDPAS